MKIIPTGLIEDPRSKKEKAKDWQVEELFGTSLVIWKVKRKWKSYNERNQHTSSSCVAQSMAKAFEVNEKTETKATAVFSASPIYALRSNKPQAGMWLQNAMEIAKSKGTTLEMRIKSQMMTDSQMEKETLEWNSSDTEIAELYGISGYAFESSNVDKIAQHIEAGRGVLIIFFSSRDEWATTDPYVDTKVNRNNADVFHCVSAVDYGIRNGKNVIKIEDSAHFAGISERYLTQKFLAERCTGVGIIFDRDNNYTVPNEKYIFDKYLEMEMGMRNTNVVKLQDTLKRVGCFPVVTNSTGYYGEITRQAVDKFTRKYNVASLWELNYVRGRWVGNKTRAKLNEV